MHIKLRQIDKFNFVHPIKSNFAIEKSQEEHVAIINKKGIQILLLILNPNNSTSVSYSKQFVHVPEYFIANHLGINLPSIFHLLSRDEVYTCILQGELFTALPNSTIDFSHPIYCKWSPSGAIGHQCVLSFLTNTGGLFIFAKLHLKNGLVFYKKLANITELHINEFKSTWSDVDAETPNKQYEEFMKRLQFHMPTAMVWTHMCSEGIIQYCLLIVAHNSGQITFWRLNFVNAEDYSKAHFDFVCDERLSISDITSMHWIPMGANSGFIICGNRNGQVLGFPVSNTSKYYTKCLDPMQFHKSDDLQVSYIESMRKEDTIFIFCVHQSYIFIHAIHDGAAVDSICYNAGNLLITGLQKFNETLLVLTQTGVMKQISFSIVNNKIQLSINPIDIGINWNTHVAISFYFSPNGAIFSLIVEESVFSFQRLSQPRKMINFVNEGVNFIDLLLKNPFKSLQTYHDCLEALRLTSIINQICPLSIIAEATNYDSLSLPELKIHYFISKISELVAEEAELIPDKPLKTSGDVLTMIQIKLAVYLLRIIFKNHEKNASINNFEKQSLHFISSFLKEIVSRNFLQEHNLKEIFVDEIFDVLLRCKNVESVEIPCLVCENSLISTTCINEHIDTRCAITFSQIINTKFKCTSCKKYVDENATFLTKCYSCPYCDSHLDVLLPDPGDEQT